MMITLPGCVVSLLSLAYSFYLLIYFENLAEFAKWCALVSLLLYIAFFSIGMGSTPWTVNSEIYPLRLRSIAVGLATMANWISNFVVSMTFLSIMSSEPGEVLAWVVLAGFALFWVYYVIPETKGKRLEEILPSFGIQIEASYS